MTTHENTEVGGIAAERLRAIVGRIERLEEEKKALSSDIKDIFAEAKSAGFDVTVLRAVIRLRQKEPEEVEEQETLLDLYRRIGAQVEAARLEAARLKTGNENAA